MGYDAIIRDAIGLINNETKTLQVREQIRIYRFIEPTETPGPETVGDEDYQIEPVIVDALVEPSPKATYRKDGVELPVMARITILRPLYFLVHPKDKIVLQDGRTGPIVDQPGLLDPTTNRPYFAEISLGQP